MKFRLASPQSVDEAVLMTVLGHRVMEMSDYVIYQDTVEFCYIYFTYSRGKQTMQLF